MPQPGRFGISIAVAICESPEYLPPLRPVALPGPAPEARKIKSKSTKYLMRNQTTANAHQPRPDCYQRHLFYDVMNIQLDAPVLETCRNMLSNKREHTYMNAGVVF